MDPVRISFDWLDDGALPLYEGCPAHAVCGQDGGWIARNVAPDGISIPFDRIRSARPLVPLLEFFPGTKFPRWIRNRIREVRIPGRFVMPFRPSGRYLRNYVMAGLLFLPDFPEDTEEPHFSGPLDQASRLAMKVLCPPEGVDTSKLHPAIAAMMQAMVAKRVVSQRLQLEMEARRRAAELLVADGLTEERLAAMTVEMRLECERAALRRGKKEALQRAEVLLLGALSQTQRNDYLATKAFFVTGSDGRQYRIRSLFTHNVRSDGPEPFDYCAIPNIEVPMPDQLLAQKLLLETDAPGFLKVANRYAASDRVLNQVDAHQRIRESFDSILD